MRPFFLAQITHDPMSLVFLLNHSSIFPNPDTPPSHLQCHCTTDRSAASHVILFLETKTSEHPEVTSPVEAQYKQKHYNVESHLPYNIYIKICSLHIKPVSNKTS